MRKLRVQLVGIIACLFLITLSVSCDADDSADIQKFEDTDTKAIGKDEIDNDDI